MTRLSRLVLLMVGGVVIGSAMVFGQQLRSMRGAAAPSGYGAGQPSTLNSNFTGVGSLAVPYFYPSYGGYGGYYPPFYYSFTLPPAYPYLPNYWWVSMYPIADPRQDGYNPSSGYPRESVTTLLLATQPAKSRIILDGIFVGTSNYLGPIQLPIGEHTLRVEASGYEPSETVLKVEHPVVQQLEIRLTPAPPGAKAGPQS